MTEYTKSFKIGDWRLVDGFVYDWGRGGFLNRPYAVEVIERKEKEIKKLQNEIGMIIKILKEEKFKEDE